METVINDEKITYNTRFYIRRTWPKYDCGVVWFRVSMTLEGNHENLSPEKQRELEETYAEYHGVEPLDRRTH